MSLTGIALIIIAVAVLVLVMALLPTIAAVRKSAVALGALADMFQVELKPVIQDLNTLQGELKPIVQDLSAVVNEMKIVGGGVAEHTEDVTRFMSALGETGANLSAINRSVSVVAGVMNTTNAWATGAKVAGKYLLQHYLKKRGGL